MTAAAENVSFEVHFGPSLPVSIGDVLPFNDDNGELLCMVRVTSINFRDGEEVDIGLEIVEQ